MVKKYLHWLKYYNMLWLIVTCHPKTTKLNMYVYILIIASKDEAQYLRNNLMFYILHPGWLYDVTHLYTLSFWMAGSSVMISWVALMPIVISDIHNRPRLNLHPGKHITCDAKAAQLDNSDACNG